MSIRTYSELITFNTFEERFEYLRCNGNKVWSEEFLIPAARYQLQQFYHSYEWRRIRDKIILRDNGCDLGIPGREIYGSVSIHHINPIVLQDVVDLTPYLLNPEYLISVSDLTHKAIHYSDATILATGPIERTANDTCPWKQKGG